MATIIPAILVQTKEEFQARLDALPDDVGTVSIDIMDETFVEPSTFADAETVATINREVLFELDLMVNDPLPFIRAWAKIAHTTRAIVHVEIDQDVRSIVSETRDLGLEVGIALLPKTQPQDIEHLLNDVDMVLVRGNEPGHSGRPYDPEMTKKIEWLHREYLEMMINVDIGVNEETIPALVAAGATHLSVNSAIFAQDDPAAAYSHLTELAQN